MSKTKDYILKSQEQDLDQQEQLHELYSEIEQAEERKRIQDLQQAARGEFDIFAEIKKFNKAYKESL